MVVCCVMSGTSKPAASDPCWNTIGLAEQTIVMHVWVGLKTWCDAGKQEWQEGGEDRILGLRKGVLDAGTTTGCMHEDAGVICQLCEPVRKAGQVGLIMEAE